MRHVLRAAALLAAAELAACGDNPPPAPQPALAVRAPEPEGTLLLRLPEAPPVRLTGIAELRRGAPAICAETVPVVAQPQGGGDFLLLMTEPGFAVTRETQVGRRSTPPRGEAPDPALALNLAGTNNGRCDYLVRLRQG